MAIYTDILEEWDDKISDESNIEDKNLRPVEWIDSYSNDANKTELKNLLEKTFDKTTDFIYSIY